MSLTVELIKSRLESNLAPTQIDIIDDSHAHAGHASAKGGGHYTVIIVSNAFEGKSLVQRHQLVYKAVADLMQTEIHALSIKASTPSE